MESRVDYAARPDFGAHVVRLGDAELRRLLSVACPGVPIPGSRTETAQLLMTRDAAHASVSAATPDVMAVVKMVHVLEDSAAVDDLVAVSFWASEADTMPHDGDGPPSTARIPATATDITDLLGRARDLGLAWEEPVGVWNVPPHVSDVLMQDPTMATPVDCLLQFNDRGVLLERMLDLGIVTEAETAELTDDELLARLRAFMCSPRRVRTLVAMAPHHIQKQLLLFAREGVYLDQRDWGERRAEAVDWAERHLLAVRFEVPKPVHTTETASESTGDVHPRLPGQFELDLAVSHEEPVRDDLDYNASLLSPVALALKMGRHWIPRPHPEEQRPAVVDPESQVLAATAAVSVATTLMQTWEDGGFLGGSLMEFAGAVAVNDFAAAVGADDVVVAEVVGMLAAAGFIHPADGQPTARSAQKWFSADASQRWAWLVAVWLRGPDRWLGEDSADWMPTAEMMATVARRARRHLVMFGAELDDEMMWYPCCIESRLAWRCGALFDGIEDIWMNLVHRTTLGAKALGLLIDGAGGAPIRAVAAAMTPAWFTGQEPSVDEAMEMIHAEAPELIPVGEKAQLLTPPSMLVANRVEVVAMVRGVPSRSLAVALDSVAVREKCGATSLWLFTDDALADALDDADGRWQTVAAKIAGATGKGGGPKLLLIHHRLRAISEARGLEDLLPELGDPYDPATDLIDERAGAVDVAGDVGDPDAAAPVLFAIDPEQPRERENADQADDGEDDAAQDDAAKDDAAKDAAAQDSGIEDPYKRPDPGTGPGVPVQPPLF